MELVASEIANLPGVEMHAYRAGEVLLPTERVKRMHICVRDGALGLRLAVGRANHAILDVFGPGSMLTGHSPHRRGLITARCSASARRARRS